MSEEGRRILNMLAEGKITVEEAEKLLVAVAEPAGPAQAPALDGTPSPKTRAKYLRVRHEKQGADGGDGGERVNIRIPLELLRAGLKLSALLPDEAKAKVGPALRAKGIDLDLKGVKPEDIDELLGALEELTIDVESENKKETVRIFCE
jgi:hypothetical protein